MSAMFRSWVQRIGRTFAAFTPGQKLVVILAVVALGVSGVVFSGVINKPTYAPLFTGLSATDASKVIEELNAAGTPNELTDGGTTILVPRDKVYTERVRLSGQGLPAGDTGGYPLLDKQGITSSEFQQQISYQRAMEGELAKTLQAMEGVDTAVVHLAIPKRDVFATEDGKPTASVLIKTRAGTQLNGEQIQAVVHLVSSSVEKLEPDKVTVTDSTGRVLSSSREHGGAGATDLRSRQTRDYEERLSGNIRAALERVVGPGNAVVQVTADLDFDTTKTKSRTFTDPNPNTRPLAESGTTEKYAGAGGGGIPPVGVLGPDNQSNFDRDGDGDDNADGDAAAGNDDGGNDYEKVQSSKTNPINEQLEERQAAAGSVRKLGIGVLLNAKVAGTIDPADLQALVSSAASLDPERGDQIKISSLPFDTSAQEKAAKDLEDQLAAEKRAELMSIAKTASLIFAIALLLLMAVIGGRKRSKAAAALRRAEMEAVKKRMEQLEIERLRSLETGARPGELEAGDPDRQHMLAVREEISELVESQPDEVAQLLRTWLADRRA